MSQFQDSQIKISDEMVMRALSFFERSYFYDVPEKAAYVEFAQELFDSVLAAQPRESRIIVTDEMRERVFEYFSNSKVLENPSVAKSPGFVKGLLSFSLLGDDAAKAAAA